MQRSGPVIAGRRYFSLADVLQAAGISRQTFWRWRQQGLVPKGSLFQGRRLVYTESEAAKIREFAERIVPLGA